MHIVAVIIIIAVIVAVIAATGRPTPIPIPIRSGSGSESRWTAEKRFRTTGGAGICPSISEYYDPVKGYCLTRPKMVHCAEYGGGRCFFDSECCSSSGGGVCDRFGECQCGPGFASSVGSYSR